MTLLDHPPVTVVRRTPVRWTKAEYNDAVERGWLRKRNVYLSTAES
jgi:hypothetical protein